MLKQIRFYLNTVNSFSSISFYIYIVTSTLTSLVQSLGIVSILPLITILTKPNEIIKNDYFQKFYFLKYESSADLVIQFSFLFLIFNIIAIVSFFLTFLVGEYCVTKVIANLKVKIFKLFIDNDLKTSSHRSNLQNYVNFELAKFRLNLLGTIGLFNSIITLFVFLISLCFIRLEIIYGVCLVIFFYIVVYFFQKKVLIKLSLKQSDLSKKIQQVSLFFILAIKDTLALNIGNKLIKSLKDYQNTTIKLYVKSLAYTTFPRYLFEVLIYIVFVVIIFIFYQKKLITSDIPIYATLALFTWKSVPLIFNVYRIFALIRSNESTHKKYLELTKELKQKKQRFKKIKDFKILNLKNIKFSFNQEKKFQYNILIKNKDRILISGKSGSGKTTLLNIISGILLPDSGEYYINNKKLNLKNLSLEFIGYVTQSPILFPGSIFENITFASKKKNYDARLLKKVFDVCGLSDVVKYEDIKSKYLEFDSPELSGGQKQRLGIARILYTNPKLLILDESTSSLDKASEIKVLKSIIKEFKNLSIICVSHRPQKELFNKVIKI